MSEEHEVWMHCYLCHRNGDDVMYDGAGEMILACNDCCLNQSLESEEE